MKLPDAYKRLMYEWCLALLWGVKLPDAYERLMYEWCLALL